MCQLESVGYFSPPVTMHEGALSPRDYAALRLRIDKSHLILAICLAIHDLSGLVIRVAIS